MSYETDKLDFTQSLLKAFQQEDESVIYKKGELLTAEGEVENNLYFIEEGAVKVFYQSELIENIIRLGYNGSMLNSLSSFFNRKPSELFIEAIRETRVKVLKRNKVVEIIEGSSGYSQFLETILVQQLDREIDLMHDSPQQRLTRVLARSPHLFQHVPLKYIASYLRMSPETLSRIRKS